MIDIVGRPFQFKTEQLKQILPLSMQSKEDLANLSLEIRFDVTEKGQVRNTEVYSELAPGRLIRTIKSVMRTTRFRPKIINGEVTSTSQHVIIQTFGP